jgi:hypothetical protein
MEADFLRGIELAGAERRDPPEQHLVPIGQVCGKYMAGEAVFEDASMEKWGALLPGTHGAAVDPIPWSDCKRPDQPLHSFTVIFVGG